MSHHRVRRPRAHAGSHRPGASGQAAVEVVALLPILAVVAAVCWQLALAGHATWAAGSAARAAARADALGEEPASAARRALPSDLRRGLRLSERPDGSIRVEVLIPRVMPHLDFGRAAASAQFPSQGA